MTTLVMLRLLLKERHLLHASLWVHDWSDDREAFHGGLAQRELRMAELAQDAMYRLIFAFIESKAFRKYALGQKLPVNRIRILVAASWTDVARRLCNGKHGLC